MSKMDVTNMVVVGNPLSDKAGCITEKVKYKGKICVAKRIAIGNINAKDKLIESLDKQVTFSSKLTSDAERQKIVLFDERVVRGNSIVFIRDYVEGEPLSAIISKKRPEWQEAIRWIKNIASIVRQSHSLLHIIHGNLKPSNILKIGDNAWSIVDWDLIRISEQILAPEVLPIPINNRPGSAQYMSPEQCACKSIDEQTDVYALGVILYQLLTGKTPFSGSSQDINSRKQWESVKPFVREFSALNIPSSLADLIERSLKEDKKSRIQNVAKFIEELNKIMDEIQKKSEGAPSSTDTGSDIEKDNMTKKVNGTKIVIVGPPHSGKTVLVGGLYRSHLQNKFNVSAFDSSTAAYLDIIVAELQAGKWPVSTMKDNFENLYLNLNVSNGKGRNSIVVEVKDYSGEDLKKDTFCKDIIGDNPDAVFFLLNPGMPCIADMYSDKEYNSPQEKNTASYENSLFISKMNECVNYMKKMPKRPIVAVLVTAADRLESDLKQYQDEFNKITSKICSDLKINGFTWKGFDVSVCKPLDNQNVPVFDPQHIHEPFLWALNTMRQQHIWKRSFIAAALVFILLFLGLACCGYIYRTESNTVEQFSREVAQVKDKYPNRLTSSVQYEYVSELNTTLDDNKSIQFLIGKYINTKYVEKHVKTIKDLEKSIDEGRVEYMNLLLKEYDLTPDSNKFEEIKQKLPKIQEWQPYLKENVKFIAPLVNQIKDLIIDKSLKDYENRFAEIKKMEDKDELEPLNRLNDDIIKNEPSFSKDRISEGSELRKRLDSIKNEIVDERVRLYGGDFEAFVKIISAIDSVDDIIKDCIRPCSTWLINNKNSENPSFHDAEKLFCEKVTAKTIQIVKNCMDNTNNQKEYNTLRSICAIVGIVGDNAICEYTKNQNIYTFAKEYMNWYQPLKKGAVQNRQYTITVTALYGSSSFKSGGYVYKINDIPGPEKWWWTKETFKNEWVKIDMNRNENRSYWDKHRDAWKKFEDSLTSTLEPWEKYQIKLEMFINNATRLAGCSDKGETTTKFIHPTEASDKVSKTFSMEHGNLLKVEYKVTGRLLGDIVKECGLSLNEKPLKSGK